MSPPAAPLPNEQAYVLLEARHVDALTTAVSALNMTMARVERVVIKLTEAIAGVQHDTAPITPAVVLEPR